MLAFKREGLKGLASKRVLTESDGTLAVAFRIRIEEKIPNKVGAKTQPCLTSLTTSKGWDIEPSNCIVLLMFSWKAMIMLSRIGGHPTFWRIRKRALRLT